MYSLQAKRRVEAAAVRVGKEEFQRLIEQQTQSVQNGLETFVDGTKDDVVTYDWTTLPSQVRWD